MELTAQSAPEKIQHLITSRFVHDPHNPELNFEVGVEYDNIGQTAGAVSFYLRAAEKATNPLLQYEALIRCALCFDSQGSRNYTTRGLLQHAICVLPTRPEGYFLLSRFHERKEEWQEAYMMASIGLGVCNFDQPTPQPALRTNVQYPGKYGLLFQKAVPSWWIGLCTETREMLQDLKHNYNMDQAHTDAVNRNIKNIGGPALLTAYDISKADKLRYKFPGHDAITTNHSQSFQDMFVLSMTNGKKGGTYLEVGCDVPFHNNNTALLETEFGWKGISLDLNRESVNKFFRERKNTVMCLDATQIDFKRLLDSSPMGNHIDYLQIDCDPPYVSFEILKHIPFNTYKFATITFEHDNYRDDQDIRAKSRELLYSHGYVLVASDIAFNNSGDAYEDWWAHPDLVNPEILIQMLDNGENAKFCKDYMLPS